MTNGLKKIPKKIKSWSFSAFIRATQDRGLGFNPWASIQTLHQQRQSFASCVRTYNIPDFALCGMTQCSYSVGKAVSVLAFIQESNLDPVYEPVYRVTCTWLQIPCLTMLFLQLVTLVSTISVHHMDTRATHCSPDGYPCYSLVCCRSHGRFYPTGTFVLVKPYSPGTELLAVCLFVQ